MYEGCTFTETVDLSAEGASQVSGADTLDKCLEACKTDFDTCQAVEYSDAFKCYMHTSATYEDNGLMDNVGVTIYKLIECGEWMLASVFVLTQ